MSPRDEHRSAQREDDGSHSDHDHQYSLRAGRHPGDDQTNDYCGAGATS